MVIKTNESDMILLFPDSFMITRWLKIKKIKAFMRWNKKNFPGECILISYLLARVYSENLGLIEKID